MSNFSDEFTLPSNRDVLCQENKKAQMIMPWKYIREEIDMIHHHVTQGKIDPEWLRTHSHILAHYAEEYAQAARSAQQLEAQLAADPRPASSEPTLS